MSNKSKVCVNQTCYEPLNSANKNISELISVTNGLSAGDRKKNLLDGMTNNGNFYFKNYAIFLFACPMHFLSTNKLSLYHTTYILQRAHCL